MTFKLEHSINQSINLHSNRGVELYIKREDKIHPFVSGNKYRKLKYNLLEAENLGFKTLLTYGGAYSNHIAAVASAGQALGLRTIGVIRGDELRDIVADNPTLRYAQDCGMQFKFVSRAAYRAKNSISFLDKLKAEFGMFYLIPEGGTNALAIKGCEEILTELDKDYDYICCPVGTGGTIAGLINCSKPRQQVLGFPALKGDFLNEDISTFANKTNWKLINKYHFGGYAKINAELVTFINQFKKDQDVLLDPVYTGKMMFGILDLIKRDEFPKGSKILAIHTGGLQGISGMNSVLKRKKIPVIEI